MAVTSWEDVLDVKDGLLREGVAPTGVDMRLPGDYKPGEQPWLKTQQPTVKASPTTNAPPSAFKMPVWGWVACGSVGAFVVLRLLGWPK